ncbi:hypothetical protein [uncultured Intestinimonas sp.]|uniref:hypothetical protein n=1 Tax=uncultured Intestinimonas sp. TaxID=1689265 RepID=UPI0025D91398|nr:hypothetical protein [uncultured Intestinimonas sp.]
MEVRAILYTSATGFTERYARMLSEAAGLPACPAGGPDLPSPGSPVVYLGWLYAGRVRGLGRARGRYDLRAVCAVGMAPPEMVSLPRLAEDNGLGDTPLFYLRGGYAPDRLPLPWRVMMAPMARKVARDRTEDPTALAMKEAFAHGGDWVSPEDLGPVLDWLRRG